MEELKYKELTGKIIGAAFEVHKFLGDGLRVVIYHNQRHILQAQKVLSQIEAAAAHTTSAVRQ